MKKRIVLCMGEFCNQGGRADDLYERLRQELGDPVPAFMARGPVTWEIANCLSMCGAGPNVIIYPGEICYHAVDVELLEDIIKEHIRGSV